MNLNLNSKAGKATPAPTQAQSFFQQLIPVPGAIAGSVNVIAAPGSGIPMRDYFAAQALSTCTDSWNAGEPDTTRGVAEWCYRVADAMIEARKPKDNAFPPVD